MASGENAASVTNASMRLCSALDRRWSRARFDCGTWARAPLDLNHAGSRA